MNPVYRGGAQMAFQPEDIVVSKAMIEVGLAVLEETEDRPLSRSTVERAFRQMCYCGCQEFAASYGVRSSLQDQAKQPA